MASAFERVAAARGTDVPKPRPTHLHVLPDEPGVVESGTYRPKRLAGIVGQSELTLRLESHIKSAVLRNRTPGHVLLDGGSGLGKTTFAQAVHGEMVARGVESVLHTVMPNALPDMRALGVQLSNLADGDVLFLDEVHSVPKRVQEGLYNALEDRHLVVPTEDGAVTVQLPAFTLVAATTAPGKVLVPLKNRFKFHGHIEPYTPDDLALLLLTHCEEAGVKLEFDAAEAIARASRYTPRRAIELLGSVQVYSDELTGDPDAVLDAETALQGMEYARVDAYGLDSRDRRVLRVLVDDFRGGPIGLAPFSTTLGMDPTELSRDVEPYLLQAGLLALRGRGRCATRATYLVLDRKVPPMLNGWR